MLDIEAETKTGWRPRLPRRRVTGRVGEPVTRSADGGTGGPRRGFGRPARRGDGDDPGSYDVRNSWQVIVGSLLIPLGVVFILIAWDGAAHAKVDQGQIPYLISGGLGGLGCIVVGGLLYWGHWLYRIFDQADLHHKEQTRLMEQLIRALGAMPTSTGAAAGGTGGVAGDLVDEASTYYATTTGSVYHRGGCPVIAHHPTDLRVLGPGGVADLRPCQICDPTST